MQNKQAGFTFLELLVFISVMAIIMAIGMSSVRRSPRYERETFIARFNALLFTAWKNAIKTNKIHRIDCDFGARAITIAIATEQRERQSGEPVFTPLRGEYTHTSLTIPDNIRVENFIIEGYDEMQRFANKQEAATWFYVVPSGLTQEVTMNFFDTKDRKDTKSQPIGLVLNPFTAQFEIYDTFQK